MNHACRRSLFGRWSVRPARPSRRRLALVPEGLELRLALAAPGATESAPAVVEATDPANQDVPAITSISGTVFRDYTANIEDNPANFPLPDRNLYLDLAGSGRYQAGDPTTLSAADGSYSFTGLDLSSPALVHHLFSDDDSYRFFDEQDAAGYNVAPGPPVTRFGVQSISVVPFSPIYPVPVVPNPFTGNAGTTAAANDVQALYKAVLGRVGSDAEVAAWTTSMAAGATAVQVAAQIINSPEHRTDQVAYFYQAYLHRAVDPGSTHWVAGLLAGTSEQDVTKGILESPEYQEYFGIQVDREALIRDLYVNVLGRVGGDAELAAYRNSALSPVELIDTFVNSVEGDEQIVESLYNAGLRRPREAGGSDVWVDQLASGASAGVVAAGILSSPEFDADAQ